MTKIYFDVAIFQNGDTKQIPFSGYNQPSKASNLFLSLPLDSYMLGLTTGNMDVLEKETFLKHILKNSDKVSNESIQNAVCPLISSGKSDKINKWLSVF